MQKKLRTATTIAVILGILLVIALIVIWSDQKTINDLKNPAKQNITAQRDLIRQDCAAADADSQSRCADDLQQLSDLLAQFSKSQHGAAGLPTGSSFQVTTPPAGSK